MDKQLKLLGVRPGTRVEPPGIIMILTLLLVGLMLVMALSLVSLSSSDYMASASNSLSVQSLYNADAGTEEAKMRVSPVAPAADNIVIGTTVDWRAYVYSGSIAAPTASQMQSAIQDLDPTYGKKVWDTTQSEGTTNYAFYNTIQTGANKISWGWARIQHKTDNSGNVVYQDILTGSETAASTKVVGGNTYNNMPILWITSEGVQGKVRRMIQMQLNPIINTTSSTTTTTVVTDPFNDAAHGKVSVTLIGNALTDSYNSNNGPYDPSSNKNHNGDVSTDSIAAGAISLGTNTYVDGQALVGPGGDPATGVSGETTTGTPNPSGGIGNEPNAWNIPAATIPATGVTDLGKIDLSGNSTMNLKEGTYKVSCSPSPCTAFKISGNATLTMSGKVVLYVNGNIDIIGNAVSTAANKPPNFMVYGTASCTDVKVGGNGAFYGAVYTPAAAVQINGNGTIFGALTGNTITNNGNPTFHYDEALGAVGESVTTNTSTSTTYTTTGFTRKFWREIPF
jgi:hypothetical protein